METHAKLDGRNMTMVLAPDKRAQAAAKRDTQRDPASADGAASPEAAAAPATQPAPAPTAPASAASREPAPAVSAAPPDQG